MMYWVYNLYIYKFWTPPPPQSMTCCAYYVSVIELEHFCNDVGDSDHVRKNAQ